LNHLEQQLLKNLSQLSLLIIEDDKFVEQKIRLEVSNIFKSIYFASNGQDACLLFEEKKPDLIISNVKLTILDGLNFIKKIRAINKHVQVAVFYSYIDVKELLKMVEYNIQKVVSKPVSIRKFNQILSTFSSNHAQRQVYKLAPSWKYQFGEPLIEGPSKSFLLTKKESDFMTLFFINNKAVSYIDMKNTLWNNREISSNAIRLFIRDVRKKLPPNILRNIPGVGYRIVL